MGEVIQEKKLPQAAQAICHEWKPTQQSFPLRVLEGSQFTVYLILEINSVKLFLIIIIYNKF